MTTTITIKQAHKLVDKINSKLSSIVISPVVSVNVLTVKDGLSSDDRRVAADLEAYSAVCRQFEDQFSLKSQLIRAKYTIRTLIQQANHHTIDGLIAERKSTIDHIEMINSILRSHAGGRGSGVADSTTFHALAEMTRTRALEATTSHFAEDNTVMVSALTPENIAAYDDQISTLRLKLDQLEEDLARANITQTVDIPSDIVQLLQEIKLLAE